MSDVHSAFLTVVKLEGVAAVLAREPGGQEKLVALKASTTSLGSFENISCVGITDVSSPDGARSEITFDFRGQEFKRRVMATSKELLRGFREAGLPQPPVSRQSRLSAFYDKLLFHTFGL